MAVSQSLRFANRQFEPGEILSALDAVLSPYETEGTKRRIRVRQKLADGVEHSKDLLADDLYSLTTFTNATLYVHLDNEVSEKRKSNLMVMFLNLGGGELCVSVDTEDPRMLRPILLRIEQTFRLVPYREATRPQGNHSVVSQPTPRHLEPPSVLTLDWLVRHVPAKYWLLAASLLGSAFAGGIVAGQTSAIREVVRGLGWWSD